MQFRLPFTFIGGCSRQANTMHAHVAAHCADPVLGSQAVVGRGMGVLGEAPEMDGGAMFNSLFSLACLTRSMLSIHSILGRARIPFICNRTMIVDSVPHVSTRILDPDFTQAYACLFSCFQLLCYCVVARGKPTRRGAPSLAPSRTRGLSGRWAGISSWRMVVRCGIPSGSVPRRRLGVGTQRCSKQID